MRQREKFHKHGAQPKIAWRLKNTTITTSPPNEMPFEIRKFENFQILLLITTAKLLPAESRGSCDGNYPPSDIQLPSVIHSTASRQLDHFRSLGAVSIVTQSNTSPFERPPSVLIIASPPHRSGGRQSVFRISNAKRR